MESPQYDWLKGDRSQQNLKRRSPLRFTSAIVICELASTPQ
ncbi:hypothetical protein [Stenomitos frigidus]|nr:hypothetical protein [Stenomitos frigidus]